MTLRAILLILLLAALFLSGGGEAIMGLDLEIADAGPTLRL